MSTKQTEALKLALEALEVLDRVVLGTRRAEEAITAIREALAEQPAQQEPKPKFVRNVDGVPCITLVEHEHLMRSRSKPVQQQAPFGYIAGVPEWGIRQSEITVKITRNAQPQYGFVKPLYTSPQPAQQQEPFGYFKPEPFGWTDCAETDEGAIALYDRPPASKPWVGLTDEEELKVAQDSMGKSRHWLVAHVGDKLREKNT